MRLRFWRRSRPVPYFGRTDLSLVRAADREADSELARFNLCAAEAWQYGADTTEWVVTPEQASTLAVEAIAPYSGLLSPNEIRSLFAGVSYLRHPCTGRQVAVVVKAQPA